MIPVFSYSLHEKQKDAKFKLKLNKKLRTKQQQQDKSNNNKQKKNQKDDKQEENLKEILGYFRNNIVEKNQKQIKQNSLKQDELEGFLTGLEFEELKRHYSDYNFADLILEFPNPDQNPPEKLYPNRPVTFNEAKQVFDDMLTVMGNNGCSKAQLRLEKEAFLYSFLLLKDYEDENTQNKHHGHKKHKKNENKQLTKYEEYLEQVELLEKQQNDDYKAKPNNLNNSQGDDQAQIQNVADNLMKKLIDINLQDTSQFKNVKKAYITGGFLEKRIYPNFHEWICKNSRPRDFLTLVRNTIQSKLTLNANLHTRQFLKSDGSSIFMAIKSNEDVIKNEAEQSGLTKQLELGYADLFSLEPVDELYRPLRLKNSLRLQMKGRFISRGNLEFVQKYDVKIKEQLKKKNGDMESAAEDWYKDIQKADEEQLWVLMIQKQIEVDSWMQHLAEDLKIDTSHEKSNILQDDENTTREEWNCYFVYLIYLCELSRKVKQLLKQGKEDQHDIAKRGGHTNIIEQNKGFLYKLIFRKAVGDANQTYRKFKGVLGKSQMLNTIWHRIGMENPISPFTDYFQPSQQDKGDTIWRQYEVNEKGYRSIFLNMEKIKLTNSVILKQLNISKLIKNQFIIAYYPIHDCYQMKGEKKETYFMPLRRDQLIKDEEETQSEKSLKEMFKMMQDEAEATDFDSKSVDEETQFNKKIPWSIPIDIIRDYFGEKIAIYFHFLSFYAFHLSYMALLALIIQIIQSNSDTETQNTFNIIFASIIIIWSTLFLEFWKREQVMFSVRFGQQDFEEDEAERPSFDGQFMRNITNDDLNEEYYSPTTRKLKMLFSLAVSFLIIGIVIGLVFAIFTLKVFLLREDYPILRNSALNANTIPVLLNSIQIQGFNVLYGIIGDKLNNFENHKILTSYENSLVSKVFLFQFFNLFNSCFFVAFLSDTFKELHFCEYEPGKEDCFQQLKTQIMIIFLSNFATNIPELAAPLVKIMLSKKLVEASGETKQITHPFSQIDKYIEEQSFLNPYMTNEEVDGTVDDYMELVIQFSFLTLFGLSFPTCFILAFLNNIVEIQVDKYKLINFSRRPLPNGASNIGTWLIILDVITFCSIFSNAGLIAYTSSPKINGNFRLISMGDGEVFEEQDEKMVLFVSMLVTFLATKYFFRFIIPDTPQIALILNKRHKVAVDTVVRGFQKQKQKQYKTAKMNFNVGGVIYDHSHTDQEILQGLQSMENKLKNATKDFQSVFQKPRKSKQQQQEQQQQKDQIQQQEENYSSDGFDQQEDEEQKQNNDDINNMQTNINLLQKSHHRKTNISEIPKLDIQSMKKGLQGDSDSKLVQQQQNQEDNQDLLFVDNERERVISEYDLQDNQNEENIQGNQKLN